jgi:hypothetical protein
VGFVLGAMSFFVLFSLFRAATINIDVLGLTAFSALAGLFAEQVMLRLRKVVEIMFRLRKRFAE